MGGSARDCVVLLGGRGFVGRHLADACRAAGLIPVVAGRSLPPTDALRQTSFAYESVDILDLQAVEALLSRWAPRWVVHLAAHSSVRDSAQVERHALEVNVLGTWNVCWAVRGVSTVEKLLWLGSAEAYGAMPAVCAALDEDACLRPLTLYGVTKAAGDWLVAQQARVHGTPIVRARLFPCTGPGQSERFVCADFAQQVAKAERYDTRIAIRAGNVHVVRDFTDVRDVAAALLALLRHGIPGEAYNICSGVGRSIEEIALALLQLSGRDGSVVVDPHKQRPVDIPRLVGSYRKLAAATGWSPQRAWVDTLRDVLGDWRQRVAAG